eukprot:2947203-Alexandrium_andersonii.AAC.1
MGGATAPGGLCLRRIKKGRAPWAERANTAGPDDTIAITADAGIEGSEVVACYPRSVPSWS